MASNLVSSIVQFLTPEITARVASVLGLDRNDAQMAIGAAAPALLAAFAGAASRPGGAEKLADAVAQQSGMMDGFAAMLGGAGQTALANKGSQLLSSLLGNEAQAALAGAVSKFAGLGEGSGNSLINMLAPVALGMIGKEIGSRSPDAAGVVGLLNAQKDNIAQAMPSGLGQILERSGVLSPPGDAATAAAASAARATASGAAAQAERVSASTASSVASTAPPAPATTTSAMPRWLPWLIALAAVLALLWYMFGGRTPPAVDATAPPTAPGMFSVAVAHMCLPAGTMPHCRQG